MYLFPRNGATLNDSFCFFMYQAVLFQPNGKVPSDLCNFHKMEINTNRKLWKLFFYERRNYYDIFISKKRKMLHQ